MPLNARRRSASCVVEGVQSDATQLNSTRRRVDLSCVAINGALYTAVFFVKKNDSVFNERASERTNKADEQSSNLRNQSRGTRGLWMEGFMEKKCSEVRMTDCVSDG